MLGGKMDQLPEAVARAVTTGTAALIGFAKILGGMPSSVSGMTEHLMNRTLALGLEEMGSWLPTTGEDRFETRA